jgi:hypothetical protein
MGRLLTAKTAASPLASEITHARPLLGQHELTAFETGARLREHRDLEQETVLAIQVLMQTVVVAGGIAK